MSEQLLDELRYACETQFRYKLYQDFKFKYMHSVGIKDIMQTFRHPDVGFIGVLHLFYCTDLKKPYWKSKWYLTAEESLVEAQKILDNKIYNENKLVETAMNFMKFKYVDQFNTPTNLI